MLHLYNVAPVVLFEMCERVI